MDAGVSSAGGFCQPTELCIPWMHVDGACPTGQATQEQRSCLAAAGVELPSTESLDTLNAMGGDFVFDMLMMAGGGSPSHNAHMMDWAEDPTMGWDTMMLGAMDWDGVDFESETNTFEILGEVGMASTGDSDSTVHFVGHYADPVVVVGIPTSTGPDGQAIVRIRSVDATAGTVTFYVRQA